MDWTPHRLAVLMHHYTGPSEWPYGHTQPYLEDCNMLADLGLMKLASNKITDKGTFLIEEMILKTPLPVYADPRGAA